MCFLVWKLLHFDSNFTEVYYEGSRWLKVRMCSDDRLSQWSSNSLTHIYSMLRQASSSRMMTSSNEKHFPRYWPFVRGIHRSPVNSPHKGQWRGALIFSLTCARINELVNNGEAGDLRRSHAHYDVTVMGKDCMWICKVMKLFQVATRTVLSVWFVLSLLADSHDLSIHNLY